MCKETFLRLPEEKRARILDAAWDEFTTVSFANASINRIIRAAAIPRGSFYQYFEDKNDLFRYLMTQIHEQLLSYYKRLLADAHGDLFRSVVAGYDRFLEQQRRGEEIPVFNRCIRLVRINPGMDLESLGRGCHPEKSEVLDGFLEVMDLAPFRRRDTVFLTELCSMTAMCLIGTLMDCMLFPEREAENRRALLEALDILRRGSYTQEALRTAEAMEDWSKPTGEDSKPTGDCGKPTGDDSNDGKVPEDFSKGGPA